MSNRTNVQKSLVYPGAGWDSSFIESFKNSYSNFILLDALPGNKYYPSQCNGFQLSKDAETFFNTLIDQFANGDNYEQNKEKQMFIFYNDKFTITYYYNTNAETFRIPEHSDVFFRGYLPTWDDQLLGRRIYLACDTDDSDIQFDEMIHIEECRCSVENWEEDEGDDEELEDA